MGKITDMVQSWDKDTKERHLADWASRNRALRMVTESEQAALQLKEDAMAKAVAMDASSRIQESEEYSARLESEGKAHRAKLAAGGEEHRKSVAEQTQQEKVPPNITRAPLRLRLIGRKRGVLQQSARGEQAETGPDASATPGRFAAVCC